MGANFENIDVFNSVAQRAATHYDLGENPVTQLLVLSENATYLVSDPTTGEALGVLRVGRPGYHTLAEYESEIAWLRQINDYTPLVVANPLAAKDGSYITHVAYDDGDTYTCIMTQFLEGTAPDENDTENVVKQFELLGSVTAYLHRQTAIWNKTKELTRWHWDFDHTIGATPIWGRWQDFPGITTEEEAQLTRCAAIIKRRLEKYGQNESNYGLIHADLRQANILIEGDQVKVIDFDDCGFGWHVQDLASAISFIEHKEIVPALINAWLDGYRKILPFTDTDFMEIDTFIMMRRLQLTAWMGSHIDSDPVKELSIGWIEGTMGLAERYLRLFA
jgi:Ser/Thr protein kinase RdoA (MazF antagonist)